MKRQGITAFPVEALYPWTEGGEACRIAGETVQLVSTKRAVLALTEVAERCDQILITLCKEHLGKGSECVYEVLRLAITEAQTKAR